MPYDIGMKVLGLEEEEYCYIPMGGELPDLTQRAVAFGGAANFVHPATGKLIVVSIQCVVSHDMVWYAWLYYSIFCVLMRW